MSHIHSQSLYVAVRHLAVRQKDPELRTHVMMMWIWIQPFYINKEPARIFTQFMYPSIITVYNRQKIIIYICLLL